MRKNNIVTLAETEAPLPLLTREEAGELLVVVAREAARANADACFARGNVEIGRRNVLRLRDASKLLATFGIPHDAHAVGVKIGVCEDQAARDAHDLRLANTRLRDAMREVLSIGDRVID